MSPLGEGLPFSVRDVDTTKAVVASLGALWLLLRALPGPWSRAGPGLRRGWDVGLALLGLLGVLCWSNLGQWNFPGFGHPSETFHYYVGAKYFPELGYTRLYRCVAVADARVPGGVARTAGRRLRNLETNLVEPAAGAIADPQACMRHFDPERWRAFQADLNWFRDRPNPRRWRVMQQDHGYNATPVWGLLGRAVTGGAPATDAQILRIRLLDPLLLLAALGFVGATFGWRTVCVVTLFLGTHYPLQYGWTGGGVLRQVELAAALVAIAALRRGWPVAAGALVSLAALVRMHPAFLVVGPACQLAWECVAQRRLAWTHEQRRLLLGGVGGAAVLLLAAGAVTGGVSAWSAFADNSRVLMDTPLRNHMGLPTVLAWDPEQTAQKTVDRSLEDPYLPWKEARRATFERRRGLYLALVGASLALFAWAVRRQPLWVAVALGAGLVPIATELTCYYGALLSVLALVWERARWVAPALVGLSAVGWALVDTLHFFDPIFTAQSLLTCLVVVGIWIGLGRAPASQSAST